MIQPVALDYRAPLIYGADQESLVACAEGGGPRRAIDAAEARANAFLIAAAPQLYEALVALMPEGWGDDDTMDHMPGVKLARAAIAKARGEPIP